MYSIWIKKQNGVWSSFEFQDGIILKFGDRGYESKTGKHLKVIKIKVEDKSIIKKEVWRKVAEINYEIESATTLICSTDIFTSDNQDPVLVYSKIMPSEYQCINEINFQFSTETIDSKLLRQVKINLIKKEMMRG